ncbi:MAG: initiator RepB protein [Gammaproteobacteria bacterium]|nr:MAG: initiator RepB protein [Gammaproteobacteria bacterium]
MESKKQTRMMRERTDLPMGDRNVNMSNALARGAHSLSLAEKRIIAIALAKTDSIPAHELFLGARNGWGVILNAKEYAETYDVDTNTAYEQLKHSAQALLDRKWKIVEPSQTRAGRTVTMEGNWVSRIKYEDGAGYVEVSFTPHVAPHLLALRNHFTTYKLKQAAALRSVYAWRLFECLQSWRDKGRWSPTITEFHSAMDAPASCQANFKDLRIRIIEPAVKELREKDNLAIEWEPKKAGRKVTGLMFKFKPEPQGKLDL